MKHRILGNLLRVGRCCNAYRKQRLKDCALPPALHLYITMACREPGCTQEQIAANFCIDKTTAAHQLIRLEELGYLERRPSESDGRCRCIYPTARATALYPQIHGAYEEFADRLLEGLSAGELDELERLAGILCRNAVAMARETREG